MKIYLDSANIQAIEEAYAIYPIDGFTTNPSLCAKEGVDIETLLHFGIGKTSFYQVLALDMLGMLEEAAAIRAIDRDAIIKIPATRTGFMVIKQLTNENVPVLATAIYSLPQAILAIQAGAPYIAPYVNRISDSGQDGVEVVLSILDFIKHQNFKCEIIAASFKNLNQITRLLEAGVHSVTIPNDLFLKWMQSDQADAAVAQFTSDWMKTYQRKSVF